MQDIRLIKLTHLIAKSLCNLTTVFVIPSLPNLTILVSVSRSLPYIDSHRSDITQCFLSLFDISHLA